MRHGGLDFHWRSWEPGSEMSRQLTSVPMPDNPHSTAATDPPQRPRRSGFRTLVGYTTRAWREGYGEVELLLAERHMNVMGRAHGGVYATILDAALGQATAWCAVPGNARFCVTLSLTVSYLDGAEAGTTLIAIGRVTAIEGRIATCSAEVRDETGRLCATGQASFMYRPGSERPEGVPIKRRG